LRVTVFSAKRTTAVDAGEIHRKKYWNKLYIRNCLKVVGSLKISRLL